MRGADPIDSRVRKLPQQLWSGWALRLMPAGHHLLTFRRAGSTCLLLPGGRRDLTETARLLDQPISWQTVHYVLRKLAASGDLEVYLQTLSLLASRLDDGEVPIDYQRRRRLFGSAVLLSDDRWKASCARAGRFATRRGYWHAQRYLLELLTGSPDSAHPPLGPLGKKRAVAYLEFCTTLDQALAELLRQAAEQQLKDHALNEPLVWEPPFNCVDVHHWPGPRLDSAPPARLQQLLLDERRSLTDAAAALGTSIEHVRLALIQHPVGRHPKRSKAASRQGPTARPANCTPEHIRYRYEQCRWSYERIARELGVDRSLVRRLAGVAGVQSRSSGRTRTYHIDRQWLAVEYLQRRRRLVDIAADLGMHRNTLGRIARGYGMHPRLAAKGSNALHRGSKPAPCPRWIRTVFQLRGGLQRVQRFLHLVQYPTIAEAARALHLRPSTLSSQLRRLEREVGVSLLIRSENKGMRPMRLTRDGRRFVRDATQVLNDLVAGELRRPPPAIGRGSQGRRHGSGILI